jgi:hypothetical protein
MALRELVNWDEIQKQIDEARDLKKIIQMHELIPALKILAKQKDGSLRTQNRCSRYRIFLEQNAGEIYRGLPDKSGERIDLVTSGNDVTTKQKAERELGKGRKTLAAWTKESNISAMEI